MHDCVLGGQGGPSAPRVEHRYYAGDGINGKNAKGMCKNQNRPYFCIVIGIPKTRGQKVLVAKVTTTNILNIEKY